ncbi:MAG TPA: hypothetical protein VK831_06150 [Candidatus Deferrimicrobiaceae bacterium]|nr:hypothetical protein [Candidatus Deferrimicrobiaceae bacterium]
MTSRRDHGRPQPWARARSERDGHPSRLARGRSRLGRIVTPGRAGGLLGMLAAGYIWTLITGPTVFAMKQLEVPALRWTDGAAVEAALAGVPGTNAFRLATAPLAAAIARLPTVRSAEVGVSLLDGALLVVVEEREPIVGWQVGDTVFLADGDGVIVASRGVDAPGPVLPTVQDRRADAGVGLGIGARLDAVDLDVATRLASLVPADVGSSATTLAVVVTDRDGYVVRTADWDAVFGFYGPATRSPEIIAGQVRLLRSLLLDREDDVARIILASDTDGTYVPRTTPRPSPR